MRAISVLLVITVHMKVIDFRWLSGQTGVTAFFILSGFLISTLALREESARGRLSLSAFYVRRCFRILPAYYSVLGLYIVFLLLMPISLLEERRDAFITALPYYLTYLNEFGVRAASWESPFSQSWSLGIEEKFYLLWPVIAFVLLRHKFRLRVCAIVSFIGMFVLTSHLWIIDFLWIGGYANILLGCLVALLLHVPEGYRRLSTLGKPHYIWAAVSAVIVTQLLLFHIPGIRNFFSVWVAILLIGLSTGQSGVGKFLSSGALVYVGKRSYGIYLIHLFALNAVELVFVPGQTEGWRVIAYVVCSLALTIAMAEVLYRTIERPCINIGHSWSRVILSLPQTKESVEAAATAFVPANPSANATTLSIPSSEVPSNERQG